MAGDRLLSRPLALFLGSVGLVVLACLARRWWPTGVAAAAAQLRDGDLERQERLCLLRVLLAAGEADPAAGRDLRLGAAMAAVALEDQPACERLFAQLGAPLPVTPADAAIVAGAGLGDAVLTALLQAMWLEANGQRAEAASRYRQVIDSSRLFAMALAGRLAVAGVERTR